MWTIEAALKLVRDIQPELHARKYHVAMGGGVLNNGASDKDLDLYVFPFDHSNIDPLMPYLNEVWGPAEPLVVSRNPDADYPPDVNFDVKVKFEVEGKRIDLFMTKNGVSL